MNVIPGSISLRNVIQCCVLGRKIYSSMEVLIKPNEGFTKLPLICSCITGGL